MSREKFDSFDQLTHDLETLQRRLDTLSIQAPSDVQLFLSEDLEDWGRFHSFDHNPPALDSLLRACETATRESKSHRSRADPGLARHRKQTTDANIQKLLQRFLREIIDTWAFGIVIFGYDLGRFTDRLAELAYSKDVLARVAKRSQKPIVAGASGHGRGRDPQWILDDGASSTR